jgi:hypothetical protein
MTHPLTDTLNSWYVSKVFPHVKEVLFGQNYMESSISLRTRDTNIPLSIDTVKFETVDSLDQQPFFNEFSGHTYLAYEKKQTLFKKEFLDLMTAFQEIMDPHVKSFFIEIKTYIQNGKLTTRIYLDSTFKDTLFVARSNTIGDLMKQCTSRNFLVT